MVYTPVYRKHMPRSYSIHFSRLYTLAYGQHMLRSYSLHIPRATSQLHVPRSYRPRQPQAIRLALVIFAHTIPGHAHLQKPRSCRLDIPRSYA